MEHSGARRRGAVWFAILLLAAEKVLQHVFVTAALLTDLGGIRATVAADANVLAAAGAVLAAAFALAFYAHARALEFAPALVSALAAADIIGEFVAQGALAITITVSFVVAALLLALAAAEMRRHAVSAGEAAGPGPVL